MHLHLLPLLSLFLLPALLRAEVVINEIMYHPASERPAVEFIELHNTGTAAVNLGGWSLTGGVAFTFPNVTLPPAGYLVVAADGAAFAARYPGVANVVAGWSGRLSNSAETLTLRDARGARVDQVRYADDGDWGVRERDLWDGGHRGWRWRSAADGRGSSLELINAAFDRSTGQNWSASAAAGGTPGAVNSVAAADVAPVITEVRHFPLVPRSHQTVTVTARVRDDRDAAVSVTLLYRRDGEDGWTALPMADDGAHQDGAAGDQVFGASLPPQRVGTIVEFHLAATDGARSRTWPAPALNRAADDEPFVSEQSQNCLYQVDNSSDADDLPAYRLVLKAADRETLANINLGEGSDSHALFNATFITFDGTGAELRYRCAVRNRGHGSAVLQPQSFHVQIPRERDWKGRTGLNFNSQFTYLQLLGSAFFRRAGLTAADSRAVRLRVNGVDLTGGVAAPPSFGFYVCNEFLDSDFVAHHFPTDSGGNLYRVHRTDDAPWEEGDFSLLPPAGPGGADRYRRTYFKETNTAEDDWSDLIAVTEALARGRFTTLLATPTWTPDYAGAVRARVDVEQWMTWLAAQTLLGNGETNLGNGYGDDYAFYCGVRDPRARLIPYDLDAIFGDGDEPVEATEPLLPMIAHRSGNFAPLTPTPLYPFLRHPDFAPLFFARLRQLLDGPLSVANFRLLADQLLEERVDAARLARRKAWYAARHAYVRGLIERDLAVTRGPAVDAATGLPLVRTATCALAGTADPARTQRVTVNGVAADYAAWRVAAVAPATNSFTVAVGEWSAPDVALQPGVNRLLVQAFDAAGEELDRAVHEVWYDDDGVANVSGTLTSDTTWTAAGGPYRVTAPLNVGRGVTLTIEAGTQVYLGAGVGLTVDTGGRLLAEGTAARPIHFSREPGARTSGGTLVLHGGPGAPETRLRHVFFNHGGDPAVACEAGANIVLEHCEWLRNDATYLQLNGASFLVADCVFPTAAGEAYFEAVRGNGPPPPGGRAVIRDSFFGRMHSRPGNYNDVIDLGAGNRPGAILQILRNVFVGSDDDVIDLDGTDAWIEGNLFLHVHRAGSPDSASAISGGRAGGDTSEITVIGNLFYDVDQAVTAKEGNFYTFLNNTVVDQNSRGSEDRREDIEGRPDVFLPAVFNLGDAGTVGALGLYAEGNVIHSAERLVRNYTATQQVTLHRNLLPPGLPWNGPGRGNVNAPALLRDVTLDPATGASNIPTPTRDNFRRVAAEIRRQFGLAAASPARGAGPNGTDQGGVRFPGVSLSGAPSGTTAATAATVYVGSHLTGAGIPAGEAQFPAGSGWTHYRWRLDGGAWSVETPLAVPIALSGLAAGAHTLEVAGRNDAGTWQDETDLGPAGRATSATWTVNPAAPPPAATAGVRLNEVLARNTRTLGFGSEFPDLIELTNTGGTTVDLGGWGLSDNASLPYKYTFPAGTLLAPGAFLVLHASGSAAVPAPKTGFALGAGGDDLTLTRSAATGGGTVDRIAWGPQLADFSIGRTADGAWALGRPTFGAANLAVETAPAAGVRINEWLAHGGPAGAADFIELYNPAPLPVDLGGHFLTDNPVGWPDRSQLASLTFIAPGGFLVFTADGDPRAGPEHVDFRLAAEQGEIALVSPARTVIDVVLYGPQRTSIAQGRTPDGAGAFAALVPSPGSANPRRLQDTDGDGLPDVWERVHGLNPLDPADARLDPDGDGRSNFAEYLAGSDPREPDVGVRAVPTGGVRLASRLANLSVLAALTEGEVMTIGAAIGGPGTGGTKALVVRAAGPALAPLGVTGVLPDPRLTLVHQASGDTVAGNDDWAGNVELGAAFARVGAFPFGDAASKDAGVFLPDLAPGGYVVHVGDAGAGTGTVIAELYDATPDSAVTATTPRFVNLSVRKLVPTGGALSVGFVIEGTASRTVLLRAVGPTLGLAPFVLAGAMADPTLEVYDNATGVAIARNDDWAGAVPLQAGFAAVGAFAFAHGTTLDAALLVTLAPGQYSARVAGAAGGGGVVLLEIYDVP